MECNLNIMNIRRYIALAADTALNNNLTNLTVAISPLWDGGGGLR